MRYTTIIDITEYPAIWRNRNVSLVYLYLTLKSGYHDDDRDVITISTRGLAAQLSITHAAARHALSVLQVHGLLRSDNGKIVVTKFVDDRPITKRQRKQSVGTIDTGTQDTTKHNGFMEYYETLRKRAKNGDKEAAAAMERYKGIYEAQNKIKQK